MSITKERKKTLITDFRRADADTGSPEVQVALLTSRIAELTEHLKTHQRDYSSRRGLLAMVSRRRWVLGLSAALMGACATPRLEDDSNAWQHVPLPGKRATTYTLGRHDGRATWHADADASASLMRLRKQAKVSDQTMVEFSWWVPATIPTADLRHAETADSPVRVLFDSLEESKRPASGDPLFSELWRETGGEEGILDRTIRRWRAQGR